MAVIYLGLGSNQGHREQNIKKAIALLASHNVNSLQRSTIIETDPAGGPPQGKYLNAVLKAQTDLSPHNLLKHLKTIENQLGRFKAVSNGPRTIDLDILLYDRIFVNTPELTIPHPRMWQRDFVMIPLKEIAPDLGSIAFESKAGQS
jgi:2-amino-4-hydroxy-6-hydroxymethyldihydropteridine diphosphokinase